MCAKLYDESGEEVVGALSADEVTAKILEVTKAKEDEYTPKLKEKEDELIKAKTALGERANQFATFRKLNDETVAKLTDAERIIYENGLALSKANDDRLAVEKKNQENLVETAIRAKSGTDEKLFNKMKDMWGMIGIEANTPEQIDQKTKMILGAISTTEPNLLASVSGFSNGSYMPPKQGDEKKEGESFADTEKGKKMGEELGLKLNNK